MGSFKAKVEVEFKIHNTDEDEAYDEFEKTIMIIKNLPCVTIPYIPAYLDRIEGESK